MADNDNKRVTWNETDFPAPVKPEVGIEFFNVNSGERRVCDTEALITSFYNSSNLHVNAMGGQDMGWRLAPVTIKKMRAIQDDDEKIEKIVRKFRLNDESEVTDSHILTFMYQDAMRKAARAEQQKQNAFADEYDRELRDLDNQSDDSEADDEEAEEAQPRRTAATAAPKRSLSTQEQKILSDARIREENILAGRDPNHGIDMSDVEAAQKAEQDQAVKDEEAENARVAAEEAKAKEEAKAAKSVAKNSTKDNNKSQS